MSPGLHQVGKQRHDKSNEPGCFPVDSASSVVFHALMIFIENLQTNSWFSFIFRILFCRKTHSLFERSLIHRKTALFTGKHPCLPENTLVAAVNGLEVVLQSWLLLDVIWACLVVLVRAMWSVGLGSKLEWLIAAFRNQKAGITTP